MDRGAYSRKTLGWIAMERKGNKGRGYYNKSDCYESWYESWYGKRWECNYCYLHECWYKSDFAGYPLPT